MSSLRPGQIGWIDLTVPDAEALRGFYSQVVGWKTEPVEMDGYNDHCMIPPETEAPVAGICHACGSNAKLPPQWIIYITVADLEVSLRDCEKLGGTIISPAREVGDGRFAIIRDPAGAVCALYQNGEETE